MIRLGAAHGSSRVSCGQVNPSLRFPPANDVSDPMTYSYEIEHRHYFGRLVAPRRGDARTCSELTRRPEPVAPVADVPEHLGNGGYGWDATVLSVERFRLGATLRLSAVLGLDATP